MRKVILSLALISTLLTAQTFAASTDGIKAINAAKTSQLKSIRAEMKKIKEIVTIAKMTEKSKKLDEQIATAKEKLAQMKIAAK